MTNNSFNTNAGVKTDKLKNSSIFYHRVGTKQEQDVMMFALED
jgi:hypothetical protein